MLRKLYNIRLAMRLLALLAAATLGGCDNDDAEVAGPLVVAVSGDTAGWIVPCGCAANQSGGLPRRGTYLEELHKGKDVIAADVGGTSSGNSLYERLKFEAIARGEVAMQIDAHNIGAAEAAMGAEYLRKMAKETGLPLISTNVLDEQGQAVGQPIKILHRAGRKVALLGVLSESFATEGIDILPPQQAILHAINGTDQCDTVVVLAYLKEDELIAMAQSLPEVDLLLGGPTGQPMQPKRFGPTLLASATKQGKFMVELQSPRPGSRDWKGRIVEIDESFVDHAAQLKNVRQFHAELSRRDLTPDQTSFAAKLPPGLPEGYAVAGSENCSRCHEKEYAVWQKSKHAAAWLSLQKKGAEVDPDCQRCHSTAYGSPGGFQSIAKSPRRTGVGCESCHGPSQGHSDDPVAHTARYGAADDHCTSCHDRENSPDFKFDKSWPHIKHGSLTSEDEHEPSEESR